MSELEYCSDVDCIWLSESDVIVVLGTKEVLVRWIFNDEKGKFINVDIDGIDVDYYAYVKGSTGIGMHGYRIWTFLHLGDYSWYSIQVFYSRDRDYGSKILKCGGNI